MCVCMYVAIMMSSAKGRIYMYIYISVCMYISIIMSSAKVYIYIYHDEFSQKYVQEKHESIC